ncbi:MAG: hypothetical protein QNK98_16105 [Yoonia sp.]|nr:hypothetical protein [Octadecabacter sp.]
MLNFSDHESLNLGGRRISLTGPVDMQAAVCNKTSFEIRRAIRNGQIQPIDGLNWDNDVVVAQATYSASNSVKLMNVANMSAIAVGHWSGATAWGAKFTCRTSISRPTPSV